MGHWPRSAIRVPALFYDISDHEGASSNCRIVEASPDRMHLSAKDKSLWGQ